MSRFEGNARLDLVDGQYPKSYLVGQQVYVRGVRGVDPRPYKIQEVLGGGQYKLCRIGKIDGKVYRQENLQTEPEGSQAEAPEP